MNLLALPAFADNYIWMLHDGTSAAVVDPGDAGPVIQALDRLGLELRAILVTHHHADHVGGVDALRPRLQGPVYGPASEALPEPVHRLIEGERIEVLGQVFDILDVPGHTAGHIAYLQAGAGAAPFLFCGDTLFSAGCGRLFEGTPAQMLASLSKLAALPPDTQVCCTHEYTLSNLRFAAAVEPGNARRAAYEAQCQGRRAAGVPTLPAMLGMELEINPFLRCSEPEVAASARAEGATDNDALSVFTALREWKNRFR
ncbi:putative hydroxyacylglutathione hydrolase [Rubrivivax sp. A210]|uniref:hydroxyacylglutathione hydrolase n=1 Tax=Rubrivivax sp. A210 TaxID=2772301 RepID=UPI00191AABE8|nr:hydroxyacylglutathione hydrolase [Rubrivivax sp. A210]CAD5373672.1 putative hydroxyacylglutathione hydrolase [Rubrivivax sp. A210]